MHSAFSFMVREAPSDEFTIESILATAVGYEDSALF
jgi:hypothetical protein